MADFAIHELTAGGGILAISPIPGRTRHYGTDWQHLLAWQPDMVITMVEQHELDRKGAGSLGADLQNAGVVWHHVPTRDFDVPVAGWDVVEPRALSALAGGDRVLVHCFGGCGRSGMVMLRLMVALGEAPEAALARLRKVRPCAVETEAQFDWAVACSPAAKPVN